MRTSPTSDQSSSRSGLDFPDDNPSFKVKLCLLPLKFYMEMWRLVLFVEHPNDNSEEG